MKKQKVLYYMYHTHHCLAMGDPNGKAKGIVLPHTSHCLAMGDPNGKAKGIVLPHTSHCLANGQIMISTMGDPNGKAKGIVIFMIQIKHRTIVLWRRT